MAVSKARVEFFIRKLKWLDAVAIALGKDQKAKRLKSTADISAATSSPPT
jgi:hypothetical protein